MLPTLQIGPLVLQTPGLALLLSLWLGLTLSERRAARHEVPPEAIYNLAFYALLSGLLGGRLVYAGLHLSAFIESPISLVSLNPGLFDLAGGLVCAVLAGAVYIRRRRLPSWNTLDALTPLFATLFAGLGLASLASGDGYGLPSNLPWAIELWGTRRHPSQAYDTFAALLVLGWVMTARPLPPGTRFLTFIALTAGSVVLLHAWRGDSILIFGFLRQSQVIAWLALAVALIIRELRLSRTA